MEAKDLRIGNYVWDDYSGEMIVFGIVTGGINPRVELRKSERLPAGSYTIDKLQPIQLTEEWLLKFGFEPNGVYDSMRLPFNELTTEGNRTFIVVACSRIVEAWIEIIAKRGTTNQLTYIELQTDILNIKYVHQLQNLFFALTGEEL